MKMWTLMCFVTDTGTSLGMKMEMEMKCVQSEWLETNQHPVKAFFGHKQDGIKLCTAVSYSG